MSTQGQELVVTTMCMRAEPAPALAVIISSRGCPDETSLGPDALKCLDTSCMWAMVRLILACRICADYC